MRWVDTKADTARGGIVRGLLFGLALAAAAVALRLVAGSQVGREQIVFSYPAIIVATLLFGWVAGATTAAVCLVVAWYYVIPPAQSFAIRDLAALTTLAVDVVVSTALVAAIGSMKIAIARLRDLTLTLERRVEERTAERNRLWERSPDLIVVAGRDGVVRTTNPAFAALMSHELAVGLNLFDLLTESDRERLVEAIRRLSAGSDAEAFETGLAAQASHVVVAWSAVLDGASLYLIGRDVTAERDCNERLRQSHKIEAVGQMTGGLAHDLANYLTPIVLSLELIRRRHPDDERTTELVQGAADSTERANAVVERLLRFARREHSDPATLPLRDQLEAVLPLVRQTIGSRLFAVHLPDDLPSVVVDATELDSALLNLSTNARDATGPGDEIRLSARVIDPAYVVVEVADTGNGMDVATLARAREPFFSTKPRGEGTGLGLAMVQDFASRSGGELRIESTIDQGTRVGIVLPIAPVRR